MAKKKKINKPTGGRSAGNLAKDPFELIGERPPKGSRSRTFSGGLCETGRGSRHLRCDGRSSVCTADEEYQQDKFRLLQKDSGGSSWIGVVDITRSGNAYVLIDADSTMCSWLPAIPIVAFNGDTVRSDCVPGKRRKARDGGHQTGPVIRSSVICARNDGFAFVETDKSL